MEKLRKILDDPEATENDRFVAYIMIRNAVISAKGDLPWCQDTGTAIINAKKGEDVYTGVNDPEYFSRGIYETFKEKNLRYSQIVPFSMFEEKNTGTNLPAQIEIYSVPGNIYELLFITKGGGSANKSFLYQQSKSLLNEESLVKFVKEKIKELGTSACPPYHLALVIGGTSAENTMITVKAGFSRVSRSSSDHRQRQAEGHSAIRNGNRRSKQSVMNMVLEPSLEASILFMMSGLSGCRVMLPPALSDLVSAAVLTGISKPGSMRTEYSLRSWKRILHVFYLKRLRSSKNLSRLTSTGR